MNLKHQLNRMKFNATFHKNGNITLKKNYEYNPKTKRKFQVMEDVGREIRRLKPLLFKEGWVHAPDQGKVKFKDNICEVTIKFNSKESVENVKEVSTEEEV